MTEPEDKRPPITVTIIACNEADRIGRAIESAQPVAREILVVDSGSADDTVKISEAAGARVVHNDWPGYGPQKIFAERAARHDWIFNLDADEEIGPELAESVRAAFRDGEPDAAAFSCRWKMVHFGDARPRTLAPAKSFVRLYDRRQAGFRDSPVHDSVIVRSGRTAPLDGLVYHRSFRSLAHFREKLDAYADLQARDMAARGRAPSDLRIAMEPVLAFTKAFLLRRYWIYGRDGLEMARAYAELRRARLARARRIAAGSAARTKGG